MQEIVRKCLWKVFGLCQAANPVGFSDCLHLFPTLHCITALLCVCIGWNKIVERLLGNWHLAFYMLWLCGIFLSAVLSFFFFDWFPNRFYVTLACGFYLRIHVLSELSVGSGEWLHGFSELPGEIFIDSEDQTTPFLFSFYVKPLEFTTVWRLRAERAQLWCIVLVGN